MINTTINKVTAELTQYRSLLFEAENQLIEAEESGANLRAKRISDRIKYFKDTINVLEHNQKRLNELKTMSTAEMLRNRMIPANKYGVDNV